MRFETKFDWGTKAALVVGAIGIPLILVLGFLRHRTFTSWWIPISPITAQLLVAPWSLPQYYEVREDGLFIRQGFRRTLIPYASLVTIRPAPIARAFRVFSMDRLLVATETGKRFTIAVAEQELFLAEVLTHCPQLEAKHSSLEMPFAPMFFA